jgi:hypothetical protein
MGIGLMRMDAHGRPDVAFTLRRGDHIGPFAGRVEMLRKAPIPAARARASTALLSNSPL